MTISFDMAKSMTYLARSWLLLFVVAVGCSESTEDAMYRVARERAALREKEEAEALANKDAAPAGEPAADAMAAAPPVGEQTPANADNATAPAVDATATTAPQTSGRPARRKVVQHPAGIDFARLKTPQIEDRGEAKDGTWSEEKSWKWTFRSLQLIGNGLKAMREDNEPLADILDDQGKPLLSWRVQLLRYVGHEDFFRQFRLDEPWDSTHNRTLLGFAPDVYMTTDEYSVNSAFLAIRGPALAFDETGFFNLERISDGPEHTLAIVDVGGLVKVPWTKPEDLEIADIKELKDLYLTRWIGSVVGVTASGDVVRFLDTVKADQKWAAMTVAGNDGPKKDFYEFLDDKSPLESPLRTAATAAPAGTPEPGAPDAKTGPQMAASPELALPGDLGMALPPEGYFPPPPGARFRLPSTAEVNRSAKVLQTAYEARLKEIKSDNDRIVLARELMEAAKPMTSDAAGCYAVLNAVKSLAYAGGDFALMLEAAELVVQRFDVDPMEERLRAAEAMGKLLKAPPKPGNAGDATSTVIQLIRWAVIKDRFDDADSLAQTLSLLSKRGASSVDSATVISLRKQVEQAKAQFSRVLSSVRALEANPADDVAAGHVGAYLCFVKGDWQAGLPLLARGNGKFAEAAASELNIERSVDAYFEMGNQWFDLSQATKDPLAKDAAKGRARIWFEFITPFVEGSLMKLQIQGKMKDISNSQVSLQDSISKLMLQVQPPAQVAVDPNN